MYSYNFVITIRIIYEKPFTKFSNSERSDECINFTMIIFFFVSVYSITSRNNASISSFGGGFRWKSEYPWYIIEVKSKHFSTVFKKIEKNKKVKISNFHQIFIVGKIILDDQKNLKIEYKILENVTMSINFFDPIKILENFIQNSSYVILIRLKFKFRQKFVKIMNICKLFCSSKFIKLFVFISNTDKSSPFIIVFCTQ
ncbi:hypothetical protein AGLY_016542 [Aphis glycines]|uniref:Uncharacterized protein n=1 Tax=Aphis glycines TaxID=307491 RepID=A0A6G0SXD6_APHGL|nr:hypothetical protein AGLY_016542 [Aphis glycines]